jgi:hypothetical protein
VIVVNEGATRSNERPIPNGDFLSNVELAPFSDENAIADNNRRAWHPVMIVVEKDSRLQNALLAQLHLVWPCRRGSLGQKRLRSNLGAAPSPHHGARMRQRRAAQDNAPAEFLPVYRYHLRS